MAQSNPSDLIDNAFNSETKSSVDTKGVVDIKKYQQVEEQPSSEVAAFEQVMLQMNIADRHSFDAKYAQFWKEATENQELLSVLICEIDFFKAYHDNYGNQASSFMLLVIALALKTTCEEYGCFLARYKGDEFGILIKGGNVETAREIAEKVRFAVEKSRTEHKYSNVSNIVTLSIGISSIYPTSMQEVMKQADTALCAAKISGRNQVSGHADLRNSESVAIKNNEKEKDVALEEVIEQQEGEFNRMMEEMGIYDRRDFNSYFVNVWQESSRDAELLSMFVCELDFFNEYIANYGKQTADDILLIVACTLKAKCDEFGCFFSHLDGARFSAIIHAGNATKGLKIAEAMKIALRELQLEHATSPLKNTLTMSIGLSNIFPSELNTMKILMSKVDSALSDAKNNGYDQIGVED